MLMCLSQHRTHDQDPSRCVLINWWVPLQTFPTLKNAAICSSQHVGRIIALRLNRKEDKSAA